MTAHATKLQRRTTKPIPVPSIDRNILAWDVTKATATLVLLSLTVFTAFVFGSHESTTVNASLGFATVCTPPYRVTDYFTRAHNDTTDICNHAHSQCRLAHQQRWPRHHRDTFDLRPALLACATPSPQHLAPPHLFPPSPRCRRGCATVDQDWVACICWYHCPAFAAVSLCARGSFG
jgi:hypothetical protein